MESENVIKKSGCDKYDYMLAASCGGLAGLFDIIFVGTPGDSKLQNAFGNKPNVFVKNAIDFFSKQKKDASKKLAKLPPEVQTELKQFARSYLMKGGRILFDREGVEIDWSQDYEDVEYVQLLSSCPDLVGIIFSVIDQFFEASDDLPILETENIIIFPNKTGSSLPYLYGNDYMAKIFCGFVNWIGYTLFRLDENRQKMIPEGSLVSGIAKTLIDVLNLCNFKKPDGEQLAKSLVDVYNQGIDAAFLLASSIPIILEELMIRGIWVIRQRFFRGQSWDECIPSEDNQDLRRMLIVGNGSFVLVDGTEAAVYGAKDKSWVTFFSHLNLIGVARFTILILKEAAIETGIFASYEGDPFFERLFGPLTDSDKERMAVIGNVIEEYKQALDAKQTLLDALEEYREAKEERIRIEAECQAKIEEIRKCREEMFKLVEEYLEEFLIAFEEGLSIIEEGIVENDEDKFIEGNVKIQKVLNRDIQFENKEEFDDLMDSDDEMLKL